MNICPNCRSELPNLYTEQFLQYPPVFMNIIGNSSVGKTVYFHALNWGLTNFSNHSKEFSYSALNESSLRFQSDSWTMYETGLMAPGTQLGLQEARVFHLSKFSIWGNRSLIFRDSAGENYYDPIFDPRIIPTLTQVPTTIAMISLQEEARYKYKMDQLLSGLINTYANFNPESIKLQKNVIVTLSKADAIQYIPEPIRDYLTSDPFAHQVNIYSGTGVNVFNAETYLAEMSRISSIIREWLIDTNPFAKNMISLAQNNNIRLEFSLISSLGRQPENAKIMTYPTPYRVLDPLFWLLEFTSKPES